MESKALKAGGPLPLSDTSEAVVVALTDEVEHLRDQLTKMRARTSTLEAERERFESELAQANQWVKLLAEELETTTARLSAEARPLGARIARTD